MLLKVVGVTFIVVASGMFGLTLSKDYETRIVNLKQFRKMLVLLSGEIKYNNSGIRESIMAVSERVENVTGQFLKTTLDFFTKENSSLKEAWYAGTEKFLKTNTKLSVKELAYIKELGVNLGITDRETQINNILNCIQSIDMSIEELSENRTEKCKMYKTLGVMAGAFLAVMLI